MDRRTFLKGLGLFAISPYIPSISFKPKIIIDQGLSNVAYKWASSQSSPLADIVAAIDSIQEVTGYRPNIVIMSEDIARTLV